VDRFESGRVPLAPRTTPQVRLAEDLTGRTIPPQGIWCLGKCPYHFAHFSQSEAVFAPIRMLIVSTDGNPAIA
jgi:hypothetical protein